MLASRFSLYTDLFVYLSALLYLALFSDVVSQSFTKTFSKSGSKAAEHTSAPKPSLQENTTIVGDF